MVFHGKGDGHDEVIHVRLLDCTSVTVSVISLQRLFRRFGLE